MTEKHTDKRTILIVDDDADLSMLIQDMLEDNGYSGILRRCQSYLQVQGRVRMTR